MLGVTLGRFGDRRLEKGGPFCTADWLRQAVAVCGFVVSVRIGLGKFVLPAFCVMTP